MSTAAFIAMLIAGTPLGPPTVSMAPHRTLVEKLHLEKSAPAKRPSCPNIAVPIDAETGLRCAAHSARFARAFWRLPRARSLRERAVGFVVAYDDPTRVELPRAQTIQSFVGVLVHLDVAEPL